MMKLNTLLENQESMDYLKEKIYSNINKDREATKILAKLICTKEYKDIMKLMILSYSYGYDEGWES